MAKKKLICGLTALLLAGCGLTGLMGCGKQETAAGKTEIEIVSYKKEAVDTFNEIAEKFNETHDDIHLTIDSPNEAMTILKHVLSGKIIRISLSSVVIWITPIF